MKTHDRMSFQQKSLFSKNLSENSFIFQIYEIWLMSNNKINKTEEKKFMLLTIFASVPMNLHTSRWPMEGITILTFSLLENLDKENKVLVRLKIKSCVKCPSKLSGCIVLNRPIFLKVKRNESLPYVKDSLIT